MVTSCPRRPVVRAAGLVAALSALSSCGDAGISGDEIRVFAAASLTDAFEDAGEAFEDAHPGTSVDLNFGGSSSLRDQILAGAPADVFASASTPSMDAVAEAGELADAPQIFATNELAIATAPGNEAGVDGLEDFGDESLLIGLCDESVPCGQFARDALASAGVTPAPDTNELDVRTLLDKIASGDLDAGIVYTTDIQAAGDEVDAIEIPPDNNVLASYPMARLARSNDPEAADEFVAFILSDEGQAILRSYGFGPPA